MTISNLQNEDVTELLQFRQTWSSIVTKLFITANELHLSDSALAEMCRTNRMRITRFKNGNDDIDLLFILADKLGISITLYYENK